jgi:Lrp/AsnC family leucine-responsive transcriptional regulator
MELDDRDRIILDELQKNSDRTNVELAKLVGVSPAAFSARKERLKNEGYISSINAILDPSHFELNSTGFILIKLNAGKKERGVNDRAMDIAAKLPNVLEVHSVLGQYDIIVKVRAKNNDHLLEIAESIGIEADAITETVVGARSRLETTRIDVFNNNNHQKKGGAT